MNGTEQHIRLQRIAQALQQAGADACLLSSHVNIFYASGHIFAGYVYVDADGRMVELVRRPVGLESQHLHYFRKPDELPGLLAAEGCALPCTLVLEGEETGYSAWQRLARVFPNARLVNGSHLLRQVRSVKTDCEVELIRASARAHAEAYREFPGIYRPGMTDRDLAVEMTCLMLKHGNLGLFRAYGDMDSFMGSVLAGDNAEVPSPYDFALGGAGTPTNPVGASGLLLRQGMSVMADLCGNFTGYLDDMTRTFSIGRLPDEAYRAHQVSIDIHNALQQAMVPGAVCADLYQTALDMAARAGLTDSFMGRRQQARFVGHGVGLVINELPVLAHRQDTPLEPGMVIAIEPKFIVEGVGAVGIENTYVVRQDGCEKLTICEEGVLEL